MTPAPEQRSRGSTDEALEEHPGPPSESLTRESGDEVGSAPTPSRNLPALRLAGWMVLGAAAGAAIRPLVDAAARAEGQAVITDAATLAVLLGLAAALAGRKPIEIGWPTRCRWRAALPIVCLAAATGLRAFMAEGAQQDLLRPLPGRALEARRATPAPDRQRVRIARGWQEHVIESSPGAVRPGDVVRIASGAVPRRRAHASMPLPDGTKRALPRRDPVPARVLADEIERLAASPGIDAARPPSHGPFGSRLRTAGIDACLEHPDPETAGLLAALLFGDTSHLPRGLRDLFTRTGTRHMLALSGLHVGLLWLLVAMPLGAVASGIIDLVLGALSILFGARRPWRLGRAVPTALIALAFIPLAGFGAPASRAALALALALLAPALPFGRARRPSGLNLLGAALVVECLIDPCAALRPGVQLSYVATAALIVFGPAAAARATGAVASTFGQGPRGIRRVNRYGRPRWALGCALLWRLQYSLVAGVAASIVASLATLPIVWSIFGEFAPIGVIATPLMLLPLAALIGIGWVFIALPSGTMVATLASDALELSAHVMIDALGAFDALPGTPASLPTRPLLLLVLLSLLGLMRLCGLPPHARCSAGDRTWSVRAGRAFALLLALLLLPSPSSQPKGLQIIACDVGNGTGVVCRAPNGRTIVFDAGSRDRIGVASGALVPLLRALDVGRADIVLSHDHADHAGGLPKIARRFAPEFWVGPLPSVNEHAPYGPAPWRGCERVDPTRGLALASDVTDPLQVRVVRSGPFPGNEGSLALDIRWRGATPARVVLCGDAEDYGLAGMLSDSTGPALLAPGPIDAVLLPHHGSSSRHLGWLLDHLDPGEVWVSASETPAELVRICDSRGIRLQSTARDGSIVWTSDVAHEGRVKQAHVTDGYSIGHQPTESR